VELSHKVSERDVPRVVVIKKAAELRALQVERGIEAHIMALELRTVNCCDPHALTLWQTARSIAALTATTAFGDEVSSSVASIIAMG
jgi:hypothetical protein